MGRYIKKPPKQIRYVYAGKGILARIKAEDKRIEELNKLKTKLEEEQLAKLDKIAPLETITIGSMSFKIRPFNEEILEKMEQLGYAKILKRRIEELKEVIEGIEKNMMEASLKGETSIVVIRIDTLEEKSHVEDLKRHFEEKGFKVKVKSQTFFNYSFCIGIFDLDSSIRHKMIISWEE